MALKSGLPFPSWNCAGWRPVGFGILAALVLLVSPPAGADTPAPTDQPSVENSTGEKPQRDAALPDRVRKAIDEIKQDSSIQHDPPAPRELPTPPRFTPWHLPPWLPYAILGVIGLALAVVLARYAGQRFAGRGSAAGQAAPVATTSSLSTAPEAERDHTFDEIDALAESGAFTEAVHRLLLLVQERLRSRIEHGIQVSLTSREILRRAKLPQDAATAFATLVAAVEVSLFGMRAANAATYALCREHCRRVLSAAREGA